MILLTTKYLDEADELADWIALIDRGRKVAEGTPGELKAQSSSTALPWRPARVQRERSSTRQAEGTRASSTVSSPSASCQHAATPSSAG